MLSAELKVLNESWYYWYLHLIPPFVLAAYFNLSDPYLSLCLFV